MHIPKKIEISITLNNIPISFICLVGVRRRIPDPNFFLPEILELGDSV